MRNSMKVALAAVGVALMVAMLAIVALRPQTTTIVSPAEAPTFDTPVANGTQTRVIERRTVQGPAANDAGESRNGTEDEPEGGTVTDTPPTTTPPTTTPPGGGGTPPKPPKGTTHEPPGGWDNAPVLEENPPPPPPCPWYNPYCHR